MERKTKVEAEKGRHDLLITREFDLPLELLFKAYTESELLEQWMGTKVLKLDNKKYGGWHFQTSYDGKVMFEASGAYHEFIPEQRIIRTHEMHNSGFDVVLEFCEFEKLTDDTSKLTIQMVYRSVEHRDKNLKLPFSYGINMAHDELEKVVSKLKLK